MEYNLLFNDKTQSVEVDQQGERSLTVTTQEKQYAVDYSLISDHQLHLTINGKGINAFVANGPEGKSILIDGTVYLIQDADKQTQSSSRKKSGTSIPTDITPLTPSVVISVLVEEGEQVEKGQGIVVLSAMKMETTLTAAKSGSVTAINTQDGANVSPGEILVEIAFDETDTIEETSELN